jgi:SAM-dependent methyltransferase
MRIPFARHRKIPGWLFPKRRMRKDWDLRARENALYYIDCGHGQSVESFWSSGKDDVAGLILRDIEIASDATVLEIGCGVGRLLRPFASRARSVLGVDISGEMITLARREFAATPNVRVWRTNGTLAPISTASVDLVFSFIVFQHIPRKRDVLAYFSEVARVLTPGGLFRFQIDGRDPDDARPLDTWSGVQFTPVELREALQSVDLTLLEVRAPGTQYMWLTAWRDRAANPNVRFQPRDWNRAALDELLTRLGTPSPDTARRVLLGELTLRELTQRFAEQGLHTDPEMYVDEAYRLILGRPADSAGLAFYAGEIREGIGRTNVIDCLLSSPEFDDKYLLPRGERNNTQV